MNLAPAEEKGDSTIFLKIYELHFNGHLLHVGNSSGTACRIPFSLNHPNPL
jgi:hypothetical protein